MAGSLSDYAGRALLRHLARAFDAAEMVLTLQTDVLDTAKFDTALLAERAAQGNMTTTALANGLVRDFNLPFRTASPLRPSSAVR